MNTFKSEEQLDKEFNSRQEFWEQVVSKEEIDTMTLNELLDERQSALLDNDYNLLNKLDTRISEMYAHNVCEYNENEEMYED